MKVNEQKKWCIQYKHISFVETDKEYTRAEEFVDLVSAMYKYLCLKQMFIQMFISYKTKPINLKIKLFRIK